MKKFLSDVLIDCGLTVNGTTSLVGTATATTVATSDNSTKIATTAWVKSLGYTSYSHWNLKTNGVQRTTVTSGGTLDITAGTGVTVSYSAGGVVTINATGSVDYISNVALNGSSLDFTGVGNAFAGSVDLSTLNPIVRTVYETVKNVSGATILKGTPLAVVPGQTSGNVSDVIPADAADPAKMPAVFIANETMADQAEGEAVAFGSITGIDTSLYQSGTTVYVAPGGGWTATKPVYPNLIQNLGVITKQHATNGGGVVTGVGRANALPNLTAGKIWVGTTNYPIESSTVHIDETNNRVGIGTSSPAYNLDVRASAADASIYVKDGATGAPIRLRSNGSGEAFIYIGNEASSITRTGGDLNFNANSIDMTFSTNNGSTKHMFISTSGNVGIGTTNPVYKLDLNGTFRVLTNSVNLSYENGIIYHGGSYYQFPQGSYYYLYGRAGMGLIFGSNNNEVGRFDLSGNFGIGTTAPSYKLHVVGTSYFSSTINVDEVDSIVYSPNSNFNLATSSGTNTINNVPFSQTWHDLLAFQFNRITQESYDGVTWNVVSLQRDLFISKEDTPIGVITGDQGVRWTLSGAAYNYAKWLHIAYTYSSPSPTVDVTVETSPDNVTWTTRHTSSDINNSNSRFYRIDDFGGHDYIRITLIRSSGTANVNVSAIKLLGARLGDQGQGKEYELPYSWDADKTITAGAFRGTTTNSSYFSGNVGIGTTSPSQKLEVAGNVLVTTSGSTQPFKTFEATYKQFSVDYPSSPSIYTTEINFANFGRLQYDGNGGVLSIENRSTQAGSSSMRFVMGTTERMRITDTGNVGIGTTNVSHGLTVTQDPGSGRIARLGNLEITTQDATYTGSSIVVTGSNSYIKYVSTLGHKFVTRVQGGGNTLEALTILPDSGNVGIGTTTPLRKLHVVGDIELSGGIYGSNTDHTYLEIGNSGYHHRFFTRTDVGASSERFTIEGGAVAGKAYFQNTKVGIGTTAPIFNLHVLGTSGGDSTFTDGILIDNNNATDGEPTLAFRVNSMVAGGNYWLTGLNQSANYKIAYGTSFTDANTILTVGNNGNVGIGTTGPSAKLHIVGANSNSEAVYLLGDGNYGASIHYDRGGSYAWRAGVGGGSSTSSIPSSYWGIEDVSVGTTRLSIAHTSGYVGVGITLPTARLYTKSSGNESALIVDGSTIASATANKVFDVLKTSGPSAFSVRSNGLVYVGLGQLYVESNSITGRYYDSRINFGTADLTANTTNANLEFYGGFKVYKNVSNVNTEIFRVTNGGNTGINTTAPAEKLHVVGNVRIEGSSTSATLETTDKAALPTGAIIASYPVASTYGALIDYVIYDTNRDNMRVGTMRAVWNNGDAVYNDVSTVDIGNTDPVILSAVINGTNVDLVVTGDIAFTIKASIKVIR